MRDGAVVPRTPLPAVFWMFMRLNEAERVVVSAMP